MADVYAIVRDAIASRQQVIATYAGHRREMCPHVIGIKGGRPQALFFQFGGSSSRGLPAGGQWRCLPLAGLSDVVAVQGKWHSGGPPSRPQTCVDEIDLEIDD